MLPLDGPAPAPSFLTLPVELRIEIYEMIFDNDDTVIGMIHQAPWDEETQSFSTKKRQVMRDPLNPWSDKFMFAEAPNTGLLRVNKQIHAEVLPVLYWSGFSFTHQYAIEGFLETIGPGAKVLDYLRLSTRNPIHFALRNAMPGLTLCENLRQFHIGHSSICQNRGAQASLIVQDMAPLFDVLAETFVKKNLRRSIANVIIIDWPQCDDCREGLSHLCKKRACGCDCVEAKNRAEAMNREIGELVAKKYGVEYRHNTRWWQDKEWYTYNEWRADQREETFLETLSSLRALFQDGPFPCSCSSPICRGEV